LIFFVKIKGCCNKKRYYFCTAVLKIANKNGIFLINLNTLKKVQTTASFPLCM
jgi:hypothetical protein